MKILFKFLMILIFLVSCSNSKKSKNTAELEVESQTTTKTDSLFHDEYIELNKESGDFKHIVDLWPDTLTMIHDYFEYMPSKELRILRNEIYARYGYIFKSKDLRNHFTNTDWYRPYSDDVEKFLTPEEKKIIQLVLRYEKTNTDLNPYEIFLKLWKSTPYDERESVPKYIYENYLGCLTIDYSLDEYWPYHDFFIMKSHIFSFCDDCETLYRLETGREKVNGLSLVDSKFEFIKVNDSTFKTFEQVDSVKTSVKYYSVKRTGEITEKTVADIK